MNGIVVRISLLNPGYPSNDILKMLKLIFYYYIYNGQQQQSENGHLMPSTYLF